MYVMPGPIEPTNIIGGCIAEFENIWDIEKCKNYISQIEDVNSDSSNSIDFIPATTIGDIANSTRTNSDMGLTQGAEVNENLKKINNDFYQTNNSAVMWYTNNFKIQDPIFYNEGFNILKYRGGERYGAHYDGGTDTGRAISPILYLNDDYVGGELEFVNFNIKIKPTAGSLYLFPSNYAYRHIAHPVESGTKYAIVTWLHDRPYNYAQMPEGQLKNSAHTKSTHNHN